MKFKGILCSWLKMRSIIQNASNSNLKRTFFSSTSFNNDVVKDQGNSISRKKPMEDYFLDPQIHSILIKITGLDFEKIYRPVRLGQKLKTANYEFATDEKLKELQEDARRRALKKLQIPPIMEERKPINEELSYDPEIQGLIQSNLTFIDISPNVSDRDRFITVREPDGTLRKANWDERFRMNQIYFPTPGRELVIPEYFKSPYLDKLLDEESYIFILDSACVQYDPDDPAYIQVTHCTYDHINARKKFHELRSTRHFGAISFYLAWNQKIDTLLLDMIERDLMSDATDLVILYHLLSDLPVPDKTEKSDVDIVNDFINQKAVEKKSDLELALQTYKEIQEKREEDETIAAETTVSA